MDYGNLMPEESRGKSVRPVFIKESKRRKRYLSDVFSFFICKKEGGIVG
jgi:hypothetical protein